MKTRDQEEIRRAVRERYGEIARAGAVASGKTETVSCCSPPEPSAGGNPMATCCGPSDISVETGQAVVPECCGVGSSVGGMSAIMGYSKEDMESIPDGANMGLGCGNPVALASLKPGETVVDLGSGGGFDCFLATKAVGKKGRVIGVDMTPDMVNKARKNAEKAGAGNVEFRLGEIEHLPVADNSADVIMSNCVINLSPDKPTVYRDAFRVLKPGGRLAISDVLATAPLPEKVQKNLALVSACVGGAETIEKTEKLLEEIGFEDIKIKVSDQSRELIRQWDPAKSENAADYVVSAYIEAVKPS